MSVDDVRIAVDGTRVELACGLLSRSWLLEPSGLRTQQLAVGGTELPLSRDVVTPECLYDGLLSVPRRGDGPYPPLTLHGSDVTECSPDVFEGERLQLRLTWTEPLQGIDITRVWTAYPGTSACVCYAEIRSESVPQALDTWKDAFDNVVETIPLALAGRRVTVVRFLARTDYHNDYVARQQHTVESGSEPVELQGSLLFLEPKDGGPGLFVLHEAPPDDEKRPECPATFRVGPDGVQVLGWGVLPHEISPDRSRRSYSVALGVYNGRGHARHAALRRYLKTRFPLHANEQAVVANPWGDGHCYERFNEPYLLEEIQAAAEMGATHYQIDDGWQAGGILSDLTCNNAPRPPDYWDIDPVKFPRGFDSLHKRAQEAGVKLALWFAPDVARGYRNWDDDREVLLELHRRYDIGLFKIDGLRIYTKDAEEAVVQLLEGVVTGSDGKARLNLDVTNGLRLGYFTSQRYGTIFVENRYVVGKPGPQRTYYPWRVLRNLWQLSWFVPPEKLQFEFANLAEAAANLDIVWDKDSALAPTNCSWEYISGVTLFASPLCWLQPSRVPADVRPVVKRVMALHGKIAPELRTGHTFPVGAEPSGHTWTGFVSYQPDAPQQGLLLVYREDHPSDRHRLALPQELFAPGTRLCLKCVSHPDSDAVVDVEADSSVQISIPSPNSFRLYRYDLR